MNAKANTPKNIFDVYALAHAGKLEYHHTALFRGYVSRKNAGGIVEKYSGKFGKGYKVLRPNWNSTRYSKVDYFVEVE